MKLIWKKTSGYKRCRTLISTNPNLPFEVQTTQEPDPDIKGEEEAEEEEEERFNRRKAEKGEDSSKTLAPDSQNPNSSDQKLAETFQSQGDQLAEVNPFPCSLTLIQFNRSRIRICFPSSPRLSCWKIFCFFLFFDSFESVNLFFFWSWVLCGNRTVGDVKSEVRKFCLGSINHRIGVNSFLNWVLVSWILVFLSRWRVWGFVSLILCELNL